jgi:hypothetical protein
MRRLPYRLVRRALLPASYLVLMAGLTASGAVFYHGKPFDAREAVISDLESPEHNPRGYAASATGIALSGFLLAPAAAVFYLRLRKGSPNAALAGAILFAVGLAAAIAIGVLAPFTRGYSLVHIQLAYAVFIGICGGTFFHLLAARAARGLIALQLGVLLFLVYLYFEPGIFNNARLLTSLAFWEWMLCLSCGAGLWALAWTIEKMEKP